MNAQIKTINLRIEQTEELAKIYSKRLSADGQILICSNHSMIAIRARGYKSFEGDRVWDWNIHAIDAFEKRALFAENSMSEETVKQLNLIHTRGGLFEGEAEAVILFLLLMDEFE
ncbi:MAG: hypothetical protein ABGX41_14360 [Pseudohongiella sp.]